eukprot:Sspe_Gene.30297::Locus_14959_Transcript_1_1_Confidence_1.000_Length_5437::g.30297::m.30297
MHGAVPDGRRGAAVRAALPHPGARGPGGDGVGQRGRGGGPGAADGGPSGGGAAVLRDRAELRPGRCRGVRTPRAWGAAAGGVGAARAGGLLVDGVVAPGGPPGGDVRGRVRVRRDVWLPDVATTPWWRIFDFGRGEAQDNVHLAFRADTRRLTLEVFGDGVNLWILDDPNVFPVLTWVRVGVSIVPIGDGDGLAVLYTNGEEVARGVGPYPNAVERGSSFVGRSNWAVDQDFGGKMASIRVWSGAPPEGTTSPSVAPIGVPPVLQSPGTTTFAAGGPSEAAVLGTVGGGGGYVFEGEVRADEVTAGTLLEVWDATTNTGARLRLAPSGRLSFVPLQGSSQEEAGGEGIEIESRRPLPSGWATVGAVVRPLSATGPDAGRAVAVLYVDGNEEGRASHANWLPGKGMTAKLGGGGFRGTVASPRMWDETPKNSVPLASSPSNEQLSLDGTSRYLDLGALDLGLEFAVEGEVMLDEHRGWARHLRLWDRGRGAGQRLAGGVPSDHGPCAGGVEQWGGPEDRRPHPPPGREVGARGGGRAGPARECAGARRAVPGRGGGGAGGDAPPPGHQACPVLPGAQQLGGRPSPEGGAAVGEGVGGRGTAPLPRGAGGARGAGLPRRTDDVRRDGQGRRGPGGAAPLRGPLCLRGRGAGGRAGDAVDAHLRLRGHERAGDRSGQHLERDHPGREAAAGDTERARQAGDRGPGGLPAGGVGARGGRDPEQRGGGERAGARDGCAVPGRGGGCTG